MISIQERIIIDEIRRLVPVIGRERAAQLNRAYLLGDEDTKKRVIELVDVLKAAVFSDKDMKDSILLEPPEADTARRGDIELGTILYGRKALYPLFIDKENLLTHVGIFGSTGYGKTNIAYWLIKKLHEKKIPVLIFDFSKRNYKDLLATDLRKDIDIYTVGRDAAPFRFNPLKPPEGIQLSQWMKEFSSIFDHAYWLLGGGRHIILKALDRVYSEKKNPRLSDIKKWLNEYGETKLPARERNWLATAERPLESLCFREIGEIFECEFGTKPSEFFVPGKITILELDALDTNDKTFFIEIIMQWIRDWLIVSNKREELIGAVILEEAHHVLNREKANKLGSETVIDLVFREIRELGLGMIYIDQHPSMISYPAMGNTSTHVYMNLGLDTKHSSDIMDAANMLGLNEDDRDYLRRLPVGQGFVLSRISEFPHPFLVKFNHMRIQKGSVTDEDIKEFMKDKIVVEQNGISVSEEGVKEAGIDIPTELDSTDLKLLQAIGTGGGVYSSQIYNAARMSGSAFKDKIKDLEYLGLVESKDAKIRKNRLHYHFLTKLGERVFEQQFGRTTQKHDGTVNLDNVIDMFASVGWKHSLEGNKLIIDNDGKRFVIAIEGQLNRAGIYEDVKECRYFLCGSERIKNVVIQQASRYAGEVSRHVIFISTIERFEEKGEFEKIEFI